MFKKFAAIAMGGGCLLAVALCLGLLPATALAADGIELYVAGQRITESGCYANQDGTWTKVDGTEPASGQFYYDADTVTLTLNEAKIVNYQDVTVGGRFTYRGSVIAFSQSADVSLNIVVSQGTSTITGTGGIRVMSEAGDASLSISGPGSLEVKNVSNDSGIVLIGSKNVNLGINSADVAISDVQYYGVVLAAGDECKSTATINDGNLTASGSTVGIYFMRLYNDGPSSLTVSGNAVVDTEGSTGGIINGSPDSFQVGADGESGGIVFNGKSGTVYGDVTLQDNLTINEGETLTIPEGSSLSNNNNLTNNGTISVESGGRLEGMPTGTGSVKTAPTITTENLANGEVGAAYSQALEATGDAPIKWSSSDLPTWLTLDSNTGVISGTPTAEGTSTFTVTAANGNGSHSKEFTLVVEKPAFVLATGVKLSKDGLTLQENGSDTLTATVEPADATNKAATWESSDTDIATVSEDGTVTAVSAGRATITATAADGSGASASCEVTVTHGDMVQTPKKDATCTAYGTEGYWTCGVCGKHYKDEDGTVPTTPEDAAIPATGHDYGEPAWSWSEDGKTATATFTCKNDGSHQAAEDAAVTSAVKAPATCTEAGVTTYTATVEFDGETYTDTKDVADIPAAGHKLTKTEAEAPTCTEPGSAEYWTCGVCGKHYKDEDGTVPTTPEDAAIPATGHEFEGGLCSVCGARDTSFSPALVSGDGAKWTKGSSKGLTFVSSAAFADLVEVRLDGRVLSASEYVVREGSTVVTLPAKLLEGLKAGDHELLIVSGSGTVRASLTVAEAARVEEAPKAEKASVDELPASGDSSAPVLAIAAAAVAGAGLVLLSRHRAAR